MMMSERRFINDPIKVGATTQDPQKEEEEKHQI
jgi:hypothetical protein